MGRSLELLGKVTRNYTCSQTIKWTLIKLMTCISRVVNKKCVACGHSHESIVVVYEPETWQWGDEIYKWVCEDG